MEGKDYRRPTYIREWREHRRLSLRQLADRINRARSEPLISYASLGRIERGIQPYSQDTLEAIASALDVEPACLISHTPDNEPPLSTLWAHLDEQQRRQALAIIQALIDSH